jgi:hypothetical protein
LSPEARASNGSRSEGRSIEVKCDNASHFVTIRAPGEHSHRLRCATVELGLIRHHRIYWGWFGVNRLTQNAVRKATQPA